MCFFFNTMCSKVQALKERANSPQIMLTWGKSMLLQAIHSLGCMVLWADLCVRGKAQEPMMEASSWLKCVTLLKFKLTEHLHVAKANVYAHRSCISHAAAFRALTQGGVLGVLAWIPIIILFFCDEPHANVIKSKLFSKWISCWHVVLSLGALDGAYVAPRDSQGGDG